MTSEQQRLIAILQYLEDWDKLVRTPVTSVHDYGVGFTAFQKEIEEISDIKLNLVDADGEPVWMEIPRLAKKVPPLLPERLRPWVMLNDDPLTEPRHVDSIIVPAADGEVEANAIFFDDELRASLSEYLLSRWRPWSESEKKRRRCTALYENIFHLQQTIENAGAETPIELVWGMGMAVWDTSGYKICHPLVTQRVEILPLEGDMSLRLRPTSRDPQIETDPFLPLELSELPGFERLARAFFIQAEATPSPFEPESYSPISKKAASQLDTAGRYWPEDTDYVPSALPEGRPYLLVTDSWVVFARKRSTNFLVDDLKRLQDSTKEEGIPGGASGYLVEEPEGVLPEPTEIHFRGLSTPDAFCDSGSLQELYFPKPFNDEQVEIIRRLESLPGVVVQGPPGTGKTHTIANVICHYLAMGKRVLVTSKGETALSALEKQIPDQIRQLTVSLLANERGGKEQLKQAVYNIISKLNTVRPSDLSSEIDHQEEVIEESHRKITSIDSELRAWACRNTQKSPDCLGGLSPEVLAREVCALEPVHGWFPDALDERADHEPRITNEDVRTLSIARMALRDKLEYANVALPSLTEMPSPARISTVHETLCEERKLADFIDHSNLPRLPSDDEYTLLAAGQLHLEVRDHLRLITVCEVGWLSDLRERFRQRLQNGDYRAFVENLDALRTDALRLSESLGFYVATAIVLPDFLPSNGGLRVAIVKAGDGKRPFPLLQFGSKLTKEAFEQIKINGAKPKSAEEWKGIADYCDILDQVQNLVYRWNKLAQGIGAPTVEGHPENCAQQLANYTKAVENARTLACKHDLTLAERVVQLFPSIQVDKVEFEQGFLRKLEESLRIQLRQRQLVSAKEVATSVWTILAPLSGDLFSRMREWLKSYLGHTKYSASAIANQWDVLLSELKELQDRQAEFSAIREVTRTIKESGASKWAQRLCTEPVIGASDTLLPMSWQESWQWSRHRGYLQSIDGRAQLLQLNFARRDTEIRLRRAYESVIEKRTWLRLVENLRMDRAIGRAIVAYVKAIDGMSKSGKGVRDVNLRHAAREDMQLASRGIPCWIMPHWRVSESLPAKLGDFDLVIVDEASQSDAWAIPSLIRGKKVLIVGDDKQVGPQPSFTRQKQIDQIQDRLKIAGLPSDIRNLLDPKESIYNLGELVFSGQAIRLREHFRCAEPIIEFSNKLCYDGEIKCVRVPKATERLLPTLVDVHVRTGSRDPIRKTNKAEADAIVEEIAKLVADKNFRERSIGVVSLLGPDQGKLIFDSLLDRIGEETFLKHHIRCGDARTFQGSEADVIFISAVDDAKSGAVMTSNKIDNIRRINVAVSRARDRLYFFHSFARNDLSDLDLRGRLMDHFKAPIQGLSNAQGEELCESGFEREMFVALTGRGYRVIPQVRVCNSRIDFVVEEYQGKRFAIECDGDQYHGPDKWMADMARQRLLERAGWKFWRCWASSFVRNKDGCLDDLVKTLSKEGIDPVGEGGLNFAGLVEFREICTVDEDPPAEFVTSFASVVPPSPQIGPDGSFEIKYRHRPLDRQMDVPPAPPKAPSPAISIGDAVRYQIEDESGTREEYIIILNRPSNWKLGIVYSGEAIARCLLGRREGDRFVAELGGVPVRIEISMKHEVVAFCGCNGCL